MENLEEFRETLLEAIGDRFYVFRCEPWEDGDYSILWVNRDYEGFLKVAEALGVKLIYFAELVVDADADPDHAGRIGKLELNFLYEGFFHGYVVAADWLVEDVSELFDEDAEEFEELEDQEEELAKQTMQKSEEELAAEMSEYVNAEIGQMENTGGYRLERGVREAQRQFWSEHGIQVWQLDSKAKLKMERIDSKVEKQILQQVRKKEEATLPQLITECVRWCKDQGLARLTKTSLNAFLSEKNIALTDLGNEAVYNKVNHELKRS